MKRIRMKYNGRELREFNFGWAIFYRDIDRVEIFRSQNEACQRWDGYQVPCLTASGIKDFLEIVKKAEKTFAKKRFHKRLNQCYIRNVRSIQKKLRRIIKEKGRTPYAVAKGIGIGHASLYKSLMDSSNPEWNTIRKILDYLGYDFQIIKGKEAKIRKSKPSRSRRQKGGI